MRRRTGLFRRMKGRRRRPAGSGRAQPGRPAGKRPSRLTNVLPVAVFVILLMICTLANAPFDEKSGGADALFSL